MSPGGPRGASLSLGTVVAHGPWHSRPFHAHEDGAPPPLQNVFLGTLPPELAGSPTGTQPGVALKTPHPGTRIGLGDGWSPCPSPGLLASTSPAPQPLCPQGTWGSPCGPQKQPFSGRKAEGKLRAPNLTEATSPAQSGAPRGTAPRLRFATGTPAP